MLNLSDSAKAIRAAIAKSPHSHLPVYETDPDQVLGVVQAKDLLHSYIVAGNWMLETSSDLLH